MNKIFESLTLDEVETIENLLNCSIDDAFLEGKPRGKALKVLVWVLSKRANPDAKIEDAKNMTLATAMKSLKGDEVKKD